MLDELNFLNEMDLQQEDLFEFANEAQTYLDEDDKLHGGNYLEWKLLIKDMLIYFNFWNIVSGKERRPIDVNKQKEFDHRDKKARIIILASITKDIRYVLRQSERKSKEVWYLLKILFDKRKVVIEDEIEELEDQLGDLKAQIEIKDGTVEKLKNLNQTLIKRVI